MSDVPTDQLPSPPSPSSQDAAQRARIAGERFELATRTAGIGYWSRDGADSHAHWNPQMRALHGLGPHDPVPTLREWIETFVHADERADVQQRFLTWLRGDQPHLQAELRVVARDGAVRHLLTHSLRERAGTVGGESSVLLGLVMDLTAQRMADQALRRADERAALAARGAGIGSWQLDWRDGAVHWDEPMWRLRGQPPRALPPTPHEMVEFVHPDDRGLAATHASEAGASEDTLHYEFRVVWPDGSVHWLASRSSVLRDGQGRAVGRIGVNWDITPQREAEAERSAREAAQQASDAKSRFLARMSHELRTPLNAVLGFTQLMLLNDDPAQREARLRHVHAAGRHLLSLIDDVLDLTRLDAGELRFEPQALDLAQQVAAVLPLVEPLREARGLTIDVHGGAVTALADPLRLRQILVNLLSNACKYNLPGGRIDIDLVREGRSALLIVQDTGRGMDQEQQRSLFQPFNRLGIEREGIEGIGIGLSIVKSLIERMGGSIAVQSHPGRGSRFEVRLPLADPRTAGPDSPVRPE
jgi:PAS domain S-box-containing protein